MAEDTAAATTVAPVGAQIVLEVYKTGEEVGRAVVHWERSDLVGVSCPPWADTHEIARRAAEHLHTAADAIAAKVPHGPHVREGA